MLSPQHIPRIPFMYVLDATSGIPEIAPFDRAHTYGVQALVSSIQQAEFGIPITLANQPDLLDVAGFYQRDDGQFWVALHNDLVVGTIGLLDIGNGEGALRKMFVATRYRGAPHGVAQRLLNTLLDWARERGMQRVYLGTTAAFLAAHRFYEKHGFDEIARTALPSAFPIMAVDTKFYMRPLNEFS